MNGVDEIGIARESLQGGCLVPSEELGDVVLLRIQIGELEPRQRIFEVAPDSLNGVQLRTVGGQEHETYVRGEHEPLSRMRTAIVEEWEIHAVRESRREGVDEDLEAFRVPIGQFEEEPLAGGGLHGAIDIEPLKDVLDCANRLNAMSREASVVVSLSAAIVIILPPGLRTPQERCSVSPPTVSNTTSMPETISSKEGSGQNGAKMSANGAMARDKRRAQMVPSVCCSRLSV
jgi:hypothetical protein